MRANRIAMIWITIFLLVFMMLQGTQRTALASGWSTAWNVAGPGTTSIIPNHDNNGFLFKYNLQDQSVWYGQSWTISSIATESNTFEFDWHYSGMHAWYMTQAKLTAFVTHADGSTDSTNLYRPADVSGGFDVSGNSSLSVNQGDEFGFIIYGSNFDSNDLLSGSLEINYLSQSDNSLLSLLLSSGTLSPSFEPMITSYTASVNNSVDSLTATPVLYNTKATVTINGSAATSGQPSQAVTLQIGDNPIDVVVTAQNGATNTYTVHVTRAANVYTPPVPSGDDTLSGLILSSGTLSPTFTPLITNYTVMVANSVNSLNVTPVLSSTKATVTINGSAVTSDQPSEAIGLTVGSNVIPIVVTAEDGTSKTYRVTVTRDAQTGLPGDDGSVGPSFKPVTSDNGQLSIPKGQAGEVSLRNEVKVIIPADSSAKDFNITIEKLLDTQNLLSSKEVLVSPIFEILKSFSENFNRPVTLTFAFDPSSLIGDQKPVVFYYDETKKVWVEVGGVVDGAQIVVNVNHFTKYAVFAVRGTPEAPTTDTGLKISDISGHWAEAHIKKALDEGIVTGYPDGTFKPNHSITLAEFVVMLANALKLQGNGAQLTFADSNKIGAWARKAVSLAVDKGIIIGYHDGSFRPNTEITRAEMAVMIAKALGKSGDANAATGFADERDIAPWARGSVAYLKKAGIVNGNGGNRFAPQDHATRAEAVAILLNILALKNK
ncbi:S-layer homology domain-containing protein [Cohnella abietis]|uniref:SLH domain-containing protein n=1 Tax=Cohnella abietis TaxID=2507935 RepID=A0A3T1DFR5_9BACL|nr:S-layer homology domain-containing protein [Cohnella abietis]BBI36745.1 hypothetical protein KCTCHS21_61440 [Cohnella abietis]